MRRGSRGWGLCSVERDGETLIGKVEERETARPFRVLEKSSGQFETLIVIFLYYLQVAEIHLFTLAFLHAERFLHTPLQTGRLFVVPQNMTTSAMNSRIGKKRKNGCWSGDILLFAYYLLLMASLSSTSEVQSDLGVCAVAHPNGQEHQRQRAPLSLLTMSLMRRCCSSSLRHFMKLPATAFGFHRFVY
ncbi:unnamed protein product [Toxocara canis]|uniref:Uncharacterized protein n=1 Tax=Toxocara canis TaxID=6265 RepID=A0A183UIY9_TOXCA|nr:unnamed protein product [Toxocara canis]